MEFFYEILSYRYSLDL